MAPTLGVIVPCRNEAATVERKLANLARVQWPSSERPHRVVVVDDGSRDGTLELARRSSAQLAAANVIVDVVANAIRPGKSGAITQGLAVLGDEVDLIVLTDADVVVAPEALRELASAFEREPRLGMATGAQTFVESLADDGTLHASGGGELRKANSVYDVATAWVRAVESRFGLVFSVHGQLMAWRRELELVPTPGIAADDLDLMLQVRTRGLRVEWVRTARFFEVRAPRGGARTKQLQRRARAYVQFLRHPRVGELTRLGSAHARMQGWTYLHANAIAMLLLALLTGVLGVAASRFHFAWAGVALIGWLLLMRLVSRSPLSWIDLAKVQEERATMDDHWETARR